MIHQHGLHQRGPINQRLSLNLVQEYGQVTLVELLIVKGDAQFFLLSIYGPQVSLGLSLIELELSFGIWQG